MSVFDGEVKVGRTVKDPATDHSLPAAGALSFGAVKSVSALSGTTGVDACLITGNKWQQLNGKHTENVSMDHLLQILGNRQELVAGNHQHTIVGTTTNTHVGVHNHTNVAPRNDTFAHTRTEIHSEQEHQQQPTGRLENTQTEHKDGQELVEMHAMKTEIVGIGMETTGLKTEYKRIAVDVVNMGADFKIMKTESGAFEENLKALAGDIKGGKLKAAATHVKAIGANLNAGIAGNADSPFA